jgi:hypothetical protein
LGVIYFSLIGSCSKDHESLEEAIAKTKVTIEINSFEEIKPGTMVVKSTITLFATQQEITDYGLYFKEDENFSYDPNIFHKKTYKPNGQTITLEFADTVKNLYPETEYFFKLVALIQPQPEGKEPKYFSTVYKKTTQKLPLQITAITPELGTYRDEITIKGKGFSKTLANNKVTFNGMGAVISKAYSDSLKIFVPKSAGIGDIVVKVGSESANGGQFNYIKTPFYVHTIAGGLDAGFADGKGSSVLFSDPSGIAMDANGDLLVADKYNYRIRRVKQDGTVTTFFGAGEKGYINGMGAVARFMSPQGIVFLDNGNLIVSEYYGRCLRIISADGSDVKTFAGDTIIGYKDGWGTAARFYTPAGIAVNQNGDIFVGDVMNNRVRKIDGLGEVTTFAGDGTQGVLGGHGTTAKMWNSNAIASKGNCFVSGGENGEVIFKITPAGLVSVFAQGNEIYNTKGICIDHEDNLYLTCVNKIIKITAQGEVSSYAGITVSGRYIVDGTISKAKFYWLNGITIDNSGNLYVIDGNNVRKIEKVD